MRHSLDRFDARDGVPFLGRVAPLIRRHLRQHFHLLHQGQEQRPRGIALQLCLLTWRHLLGCRLKCGCGLDDVLIDCRDDTDDGRNCEKTRNEYVKTCLCAVVAYVACSKAGIAYHDVLVTVT